MSRCTGTELCSHADVTIGQGKVVLDGHAHGMRIHYTPSPVINTRIGEADNPHPYAPQDEDGTHAVCSTSTFNFTNFQEYPMRLKDIIWPWGTTWSGLDRVSLWGHL
jgi:hypothetical protein